MSDPCFPVPNTSSFPTRHRRLPPGPWLVFAPHSDDETFGLGGCLLRAADEGIETHVIVVTDGALGGVEEELVSRRREEVERAGKLLGLHGLQCWSEPRPRPQGG